MAFFMATHEICLIKAGIVQCSDSYNQALYRSFFGGIYVTGNQGISLYNLVYNLTMGLYNDIPCFVWIIIHDLYFNNYTICFWCISPTSSLVCLCLISHVRRLLRRKKSSPADPWRSTPFYAIHPFFPTWRHEYEYLLIINQYIYIYTDTVNLYIYWLSIVYNVYYHIYTYGWCYWLR